MISILPCHSPPGHSNHSESWENFSFSPNPLFSVPLHMMSHIYICYHESEHMVPRHSESWENFSFSPNPLFSVPLHTMSHIYICYHESEHMVPCPMTIGPLFIDTFTQHLSWILNNLPMAAWYFFMHTRSLWR